MSQTAQTLAQLGLCNGELEPTYDRICRLAKRAARSSIATISFFDGSRHWLKARENYAAEFVPKEESFCSTALQADGVFWVRDAAADSRFAGLGAVTEAGLRFYAGAPIRFTDGRRIGNVCVLDTEPRAFDDEVARDLSDLAEVVTDELALKEAERRLSEALADRTAAQGAQGRLLSILSHELRTPLNGAVGAASLLAKTVTDRSARELVSVVSESCGKLDRLVDSLFAFTAAQEDELEIDAAPCDVRSVVSDALVLVAPAARRRGVDVVRTESGAAPLVETDAARLGRIVFNLLSNAIQHSDGGVVRISTSWRAPDQLLLSISDSGGGVAPERLGELFEPFNRDPTNTAQTPGLGLGLATTRRLAVRLGGDVYAESGPKGCVFRVEIKAPRASRPAVAPGAEAGVTGGRALIVDDHPANLIVQGRLLQALGYETVTCDSAEEALRSASEQTFDVVLTDINMPGVDGYEFAERLRSMGGWQASVPVYAVSAGLPPSGVEKQPPPGFDGWLVKPIDLAKLGAALERVAPAKAPALWRLLYVSRPVGGAAGDLPDILQASRVGNRRDDITGVLAAWDGWYVQVLEGPRPNVERTFSRIARDRRHEDVVLVSARAADARRFGDWSMIGAELDAGDRDAAALLRADAGRSPGAMSEAALLLLLELAERKAAVADQPELVRAGEV